MSDRDLVLELLRERGRVGASSREIRSKGISGNPSERVRELLHLGFQISVRDHRVGRRRFVLYTLISEPAGSGGAPASRGSPASSPAAPPAARSNGNRLRFERSEKSKGRREFIFSAIPGEPRRWTRTDCPPLEDLDSLQTVDEALAELEAAA